MNFLELMKHRYTTKKYNQNVKISAEKIEELKQILQLSPSSINSQPWKFVIIENQEMKDQLAGFSFHNKEKVKDCSHVVVFSSIGNLDFLDEFFNENLNEFTINYYNNVIKTKSEAEIFGWLQNQLYLSLGIFLSACASMEIDATPMEGIMQDKYNEILGLENYKTAFAVCIGKRDAEDNNQPSKTPKKRIALEKIVTNI